MAARFDLAEQQRALINCLENGPDYFPNGVFSTPKDRALLALKAYANAIDHARLGALAQSYPYCQKAFGEADFTVLARKFLQHSAPQRAELRLIGAGFADFLAKTAQPMVPIGLARIDLAQIEWAALLSTHAANIRPLNSADIRQTTPNSLLQIKIALHPAVRSIALESAGDPYLHLWLRDHGADRKAAKGDVVLLARPEVKLHLYLLSGARAAIFSRLSRAGDMQQLLTLANGDFTDEHGISELIGWINLGLWVVIDGE